MNPVFILAAVLSGQPLLVEAPTREAFINDYLAREESLYSKYSFNRKTVDTVKFYKLTGETSELQFTSTGTEISSAVSHRTRGTYKTSQDSSLIPFGSLCTGGTVYVLGRGNSADGFRITSHHPVHNPNEAHPGFGSTGPLGYPLSYQDGIYSNTFGSVLRRQVDAKEAGRIPHLESLAYAQLDGKRVLAAQFVSLFEIHSTIYLDPANDYAYLGFDSDGSYDFVTRNKGPVKMAGRVTYAASEEGFPLPAKFETWYDLPNGKRLLQGVDEIASFEKYTPTADDFDLEKQFGVTPELPPEPPAPEELSWRGLYAVAAVVALLAGWGVAVVRRRRRLAAKAISVEG